MVKHQAEFTFKMININHIKKSKKGFEEIRLIFYLDLLIIPAY